MDVDDVDERPETAEEKGAQLNPNTAWLNEKGSWITNLVALVGLKIVFSVIPGISTELSWTLTNVVYNVVTFIMFHGMPGVPFEYAQGEYQDLTLWEQMDNGAEFTPAKKYLTTVPVVLFLVASHYARLDLPMFVLNLASLLLVLFAKLPSSRTRNTNGKTD